MRQLKRCCIFSLTALVCSTALAEAPSCESSPSSTIKVLTLELKDRGRAQARIEIPSNTTVQIVGSESGIDAMLEVRIDGEPAALSDNPLRRLGPQRIFVEARPGKRSAVAAGIGKETGRGRLEVRLETLAGQPPDCLAAWRALASGDGHYAQGQSLSMGDVDAPDGTMDTEHRASAADYRRAVAILKPGRGPLHAQAQISLAGALLLGSQNWRDALVETKIAELTYRALGQEYLRDRAAQMWANAMKEVARLDPTSPLGPVAMRARTAILLEEARAAFRRVAESHQRRGEPYDQAIALNSNGLAYYYEDGYEPALIEYREALKIQHRLGERTREAQIIQNIALVQAELANFDKAFENYAKALRLVDSKQSPKLYADTLNNFGLAEARSGHPDSALRHLSEALKILEQVHSTREQARSLNNIARTYRSVGNHTEALRYFELALAKRSAETDPAGYVNSLDSLADGLSDVGRLSEAIERRKHALRLAKTDVQRARFRVSLAKDQIEAGALADAEATLAPVIAGPESRDQVAVARARMAQARIKLARRQFADAHAEISTALESFRKYGLASYEFDAVMLNAHIACANGDRAVAELEIEKALTLAETVRRASSNPMLRATLWEPARPAFDMRLNLVTGREACGSPPPAMTEASAWQALELSERARARSLEDFRHRPGPGAGADARLLKRRQQLLEEIADLRERIRARAEAGGQENAGSAALRADLDKRMRELDTLDASLAATSASPARITSSLRRAAEMIPRDATVVEYWLGEKRSYAWLVRHGRVQLFELGATRKINEAARRMSESMARFETTPLPQRLSDARELHALVLAPLADSLRGAKTIFFVPDGALHRISFATLVVDASSQQTRFLLDDHDVAIAASLESLGNDWSAPRIDPEDPILVVADPVYSRKDERFAGASHSPAAPPAANARLVLRGAGTDEFQRLPGSAREAAAVVARFREPAVDALSGFAANRDDLLARDLSRYRVVHFAAHAVAESAAPQLSRLVLSTFDAAGKPIAGEVFVADVLGWRLDSAELVVLSGCDTSLGAETSGEGLLGLRYAAHAAGAHAVIASMWPVADIVGPRLMETLYDGVTRGKPPVAALSEAMRARRSRRPDPAYWGAFQVSSVAGARTMH